MKNKKIIVCLMCLFFVNSCNTSLICVPRAKKIVVNDVILKNYYIPSEKITKNNNYCLMYEPWNYGSNLKNFDIYIINDQLIKSLREYNIKIQEEELRPNINKEESEKFKNNIIEREKKNHYKNCDYLITYYVVTSTEENKICTSDLHILIKIIDIKIDKEIGIYSLYKATYRKKEQILWTKNLIYGLFKYQTILNTKKQTTIECSGNGCKTIECIGDKCEITN